MGYSAYGGGSVRIPDQEAAMKAMREAYNIEGADLNELLDKAGSEFYFESEDWLCFNGCGNYNDDDEIQILSVLAPYIETGSEIKMTGEDDEHWRFRFVDGKMLEENGTVSYGTEGFSTEELLQEIQKRLDREERKNWLIGICSSAADGVVLRRICCTKQEITDYLVECVAYDRENDPEAWDYGTEIAEEVTETDGRLNAYAVYGDYHIEYTALEEPQPVPYGHSHKKEDENVSV